ncbi:MAG: hypothetical protein SWH68_13605 [Thermodesulfobacteriota bacterium]|nr:hypothetical protein [Thermodesulfobacteriota bacterium]
MGTSYSIEQDQLQVQTDGQTRTCIIGPDGAVIVVTHVNSQEVVVDVLVKASAVEDETFFGRYHLTDFYYEPETGILETEVGLVTAGGTGKWQNPGDAASGTYTIGNNGRMTINADGTEDSAERELTSFGMISPDGSYIIIPGVEPDDSEVGLSILVREPLPRVEVQTGDATVVNNESSSADRSHTRLQADHQNVSDDFRPLTEVVDFTASVTANETTEFRFETGGLFGNLSEMVLMKLKENETSVAFSYASEDQADPANQEDGTWWVTDGSDTYVDVGVDVNPDATYTVHYVIRDNGPFDRDSVQGTIKDPAVLGTAVASTGGGTGDGTAAPAPDSGGGGCFVNSLIQ